MGTGFFKYVHASFCRRDIQLFCFTPTPDISLSFPWRRHQAVVLRYEGLDPEATYEARVVFNAMPEPGSAANAAAATSAAATSAAADLSFPAATKAATKAERVSAPPSVGSGVEVMQLVANGKVVVWPPADDDEYDDDDDDDGDGSNRFAPAPYPMTVTPIPIPQSETVGGELALACGQPLGVAGNGRTCQIAEVWLVKVP